MNLNNKASGNSGAFFMEKSTLALQFDSMKYLLVLFFALTLISNSEAQKQGLCGKVVWTGGNQMPGPDKKESDSFGIIREVHIYEVTRTSDATQQDGFYANLQTKFVKKVTSKKDGSFSVKLPSGTYSVFIKEPDGLWANLFDSQGQINPVIITAKNWATLTINVNYQAAY